MRTSLTVGATLLVLLLVVLFMLFNSQPKAWSDGETHGRWTVMYSGYGEVLGSDEKVLIKPKVADAEDVTHGGLVHTTETYLDPDFAVSVRTDAQLREGSPNTWEVGWVLWNFQDTDHFYAVALKPNGWEISKQDPNYPGSQRFIATGTDRLFPIGQEYRIEVEHDWPRMTVKVDGEPLATIIDEENPYRGGAIGLYTEDARVQFSNLDVSDSAER